MLEQLLNISVWTLYSIAAVQKQLFFPYFKVIILKKQIQVHLASRVTEMPHHKLNNSLFREVAFLSPVVHIPTRKLAPRQYYLRIRKAQLQKSSHLSGRSFTSIRIESAPSLFRNNCSGHFWITAWCRLEGTSGNLWSIPHSPEAGLTSALNEAAQGVQMSFKSQPGNLTTPLSNLVSVPHHLRQEIFVQYLIRIFLDAIHDFHSSLEQK